MERRFTFDGIATLYDNARPRYPEPMFDDIFTIAGLSAGDTIVEIGCGTGQATIGFAQRGLSITALDPGADLIEHARSNLVGFPKVRFMETTFEAWAPAAAFKLVAAAQSLHWVGPEQRLSKSAGVLAPGGWLAVFANVPMPIPSLDEALIDIYARYAPSLAGPPAEAWYLPDGPFDSELGASPDFDDAVHRCYRWMQPHGTGSYIALLQTLSGQRLLSSQQREMLFDAVAEAIDAKGRHFELPYETHLYLARRS